MVFVERVTTTTRTDLPAGLPGRRTTLYLSVVTGDQLYVFFFARVVYLLCGFMFQNFGMYNFCIQEFVFKV